MYLFKKIASHFLYPLSLCAVLYLTGLFYLWCTSNSKRGKILVTAGCFMFLAFSLTALPNALVQPLERKYAPDYRQMFSPMAVGEVVDLAQYIVVLAGGYTPDPSLPVTSQIGPDTLVRLAEGIRLHRRVPGSKLICSGGAFDHPISNGELMARVAIDLGVDDGNILIEDQSLDTKDQARLIKLMVGNAPFMLVTSAYHMPRAMALFIQQGLNPIPAPVGHMVKGERRFSSFRFFPNTQNLVKSRLAFHEYLGIWWARIRGQA